MKGYSNIKNIKISLSYDFNSEVKHDESPSWDTYKNLRAQILKASEEILRDDPCAEMTFTVDLEDSVWIKTRFLHKITEEVFDTRRKYAKLDPYILADRADNSRWLDFRNKFQTIYQIGDHDNQLIITERLRTQEDKNADLLGIHGDDEVYNRDRPPITPKSSPQ